MPKLPVRRNKNNMQNMQKKDFIEINSIPLKELSLILKQANRLKQEYKKLGQNSDKFLSGKQIALIFEKNSTRTRVSFESGIKRLGGHSIVMQTKDSQMSRGETIEDSSKVISSYVDAIMLRTYSHQTIEEFALHSSVPVINGLTDKNHPCQIMADVMTFEEQRETISDKKIAFIGDFNNMAKSYIEAAKVFRFQLALSCPVPVMEATKTEQAIKLLAGNVEANQGEGNGEGEDFLQNVTFYADPKDAVRGADAVITDTWVSMGEDFGKAPIQGITGDASADVATSARASASASAGAGGIAGRYGDIFQPYQVTEKLMSLAKKDALFMHCLPAHRGQEVQAQVIDGEQSVVFQQAENRLYVQQAILGWCFGHFVM